MARTRSALGLLVAGAALAAAAPVLADLPQAQLDGMVSLGRNRPVVGAVILVRSETDPGPIWATVSDQRGRFRVEGLPDGSYRVGIRRDGLAPFAQGGITLKAPFRAIVEAVLEPANEPVPEEAGSRSPAEGPLLHVTGTVLGPDGKPAVGATLRLVRDDGSLDPRDARVGAGGEAEFADVAAGRWRVELLDPGSIPLRVTVDLTEDVTFRARLVAQPANFQVAIEDLVPPERPEAPPGFPSGR
jgi:hypothetical protein